MKTKTVIAFLLLLSVCLSAAGSNPLTAFVESVKGRCVTTGYGFVYKEGDIPISGSGTLSFQDRAFRLSGNGMRIICDGTTRWTLDEEAKECYIETVDSGSPDYEHNPALMLMALDEAFSAPAAAKPSSLDGRSTSAVSLSPKGTIPVWTGSRCIFSVTAVSTPSSSASGAARQSRSRLGT